MPRKPMQTLTLCEPNALLSLDFGTIVRSRVITSKVGRSLQVKWRLYKVEIAPNHFRWLTETTVDGRQELRKAA